MADVTQTAANVHANGATTQASRVQFGETVTNGNVVYLKSDTKYWKCDADASEEAATAAGIVISANVADGYGYIQTSGPIDVGGTLTAGVAYVASDTAGGIKPSADLGAGDYISHLGYATAADKLELAIKNHGVSL